MNSKTKHILSIIGICLLVVVIFYAPQGIFAVMATFGASFYYGLTGTDPADISQKIMEAMPHTLGYVLLLSSVMAVIIFVVIKYINLRQEFRPNNTPWRLSPAILVASFAGILASDLLNEMIDLDDILADQMLEIASDPAGMLAIALIGPITEEITFRGVLMNKLREKGLGPWAAILLSAFVFGAVHGNPAQIPFAMIVGVILGIIYHKTRSLILCCVLHVLNNTWAVVMMNIYGDSSEDISWGDLLGGGQLTLYMTLGLCLILSVSFFYWYWKKP